MTNMDLRRKLVKMAACYVAVQWIGDRDLATAWRECQESEWMCWWIEHQDAWTPELRRARLRFRVCRRPRPRFSLDPRRHDLHSVLFVFGLLILAAIFALLWAVTP